MDPLSALSLAACVVQFLDFGSKLVRETKEIAEGGSTIGVEHLSRITVDLVGFNSTLDQQVKSKGSVAGVGKEDQDLLDLATQCNAVAQELIDCLKKVTSSDKKKEKWASVWVALRTALSKDRIKSLSDRLKDYREQLTLRILLLLNSHGSLQNQKLGAISDKSKDIVEVVSINGTVVKDQLKLQEELLRNQGDVWEGWMDEQRKDAEERHAETLAAILTTRDGTTTTLTGADEQFNKSLQLNRRTSEAQPTVTTYWGGDIDSDEDSLQLSPGFSTQTGEELKTLAPRVLDALHFRRITDRRATICPAYEKTFQWIYSEPVAGEKRWDSLIHWLRHGRDCYWINGKAGSGKSTLMRYISEDPRTITALKEWAGSSQLIVSSFFLWNAGTSLQKSQAGLLRSLLLDVLTKKPELVLNIFPDVCRAILAGKLPDTLELSFIELQKAFSILFSTPKSFKVCFIVDGLDEYDGDHTEICELFSELAVSDDAKVLLSSRPIPSCVHAFASSPTLRLQDLTHNDIKSYVNGKLGQDALMRRLEKAEPGVASMLTNGITIKASGVFLWVRLVVKSLLSGLRDYDTQEDLLRKLDELPPDLEKLYDHMMHSLNASNRRQGSILLQLVIRSMYIQDDYPMTILQLSFAEDEDYTSAVSKRPAPLTAEAEAWRCESTEGRLRSRCFGFLEVQDPPPSRESSSDATVGVLHRTVIEYLQKPDVQQSIFALTEGSKFDVDKALLNSSLAEMKAKPPVADTSLEDSTALTSMLRLLSYERYLDDSIATYYLTTYLPEMLNTMGQYWPHHAKARSYDIAADSEPKCRRLCMTYPLSFLFSASYHCEPAVFKRIIQFYEALEKESRNQTERTKHMTEEDVDDAKFHKTHLVKEWRTLLSAYMLSQFAVENVPSFRISISRNVLACRTDPNKKVQLYASASKHWQLFWVKPDNVRGIGWTCWEFLLNYILRLPSPKKTGNAKPVDSSILESLLTLIEGMLKAGAMVNARIIAEYELSSQAKASRREYSAYAIVQNWMFEVWQALASSKTRSKATLTEQTGTARLDYALAERMCRIERNFRSSGGVVIARTVRLPATVNYIKSTSKGVPLVKTSGTKVLHPNESPTRKMFQSGTDINKEFTIAAGDNTRYNELGIPTPDPSPWVTFRDSHVLASENSTALSPQQELKIKKQKEAALELGQERRWEQTPRLKRVELLEKDERELAHKLVKKGLAPKDERQLLIQMRKLGLQKQSKIMECVNALKESGG